MLKMLGLASLGALISGCDSPKSHLVVASHVWPGYELMFLAQREGWLDQSLVRLLETRSATESMRALAAGQVDAAALTLDETLSLFDQGVDLQVVLVFNISAGADVILAKTGVDSLEAIRGLRVGVEESAVGALMLQKALEVSGLKPADITVIPLTIDQHLSAWQADQVDVLISYEPVAGALRSQGASVLFDSSAIPEMIFDVLAVRRQVLEARHAQDAIRALVAAHFRALRHLRSNPADAAYRLALRLGGTGPAAMETYRGLILPDEHANHRLLNPADGGVVRAIPLLTQLLDLQETVSNPDFRRLVDASYLPRLNGRRRS